MQMVFVPEVLTCFTASQPFLSILSPFTSPASSSLHHSGFLLTLVLLSNYTPGLALFLLVTRKLAGESSSSSDGVYLFLNLFASIYRLDPLLCVRRGQHFSEKLCSLFPKCLCSSSQNSRFDIFSPFVLLQKFFHSGGLVLSSPFIKTQGALRPSWG